MRHSILYITNTHYYIDIIMEVRLYRINRVHTSISTGLKIRLKSSSIAHLKMHQIVSTRLQGAFGKVRLEMCFVGNYKYLYLSRLLY